MQKINILSVLIGVVLGSAVFASPLSRPTFEKFVTEASLDAPVKFMLESSIKVAKTDLPKNPDFMFMLKLKNKTFDSINFGVVYSNVMLNYRDMLFKYMIQHLEEEDVKNALVAMQSPGFKKAMKLYNNPATAEQLIRFGNGFQQLLESEVKKQIEK
jgi:hypothetical protein